METFSRPLISIIIPTYNSGKTILKGVGSILEQTYNNWEIVIIDNLSEDDTIDKIKKLNIPLKQIKIISEKDQGIYDAMNKGIKYSSGEWLYFIGSDDWFYDQNVLMTFFEEKRWSPGIVAGNILLKNEQIGFPPHPRLFFKGYPHQASFFHRSIFNKYLYTNKYRIFADQYLFMQVYSDSDFQFEYFPIIVAVFSFGGFSHQNVDIEFANDAEKNMESFFTNIKGREKYEALTMRAFDAIYAGKWYRGIYWIIKSGNFFLLLRDIVFWFKERIKRKKV